MDKKKIIIDTDCGSDDAMAIAMALNDESYEILMFSIVATAIRPVLPLRFVPMAIAPIQP